MPRQALGRGLSALLGDDGPATTIQPGTAVNEIDIDLIQPNPQQPRTRFTESALDELAQSIAANGVVQPIVVRPKGDRYEIVAGERRWRAAQRAGLRKIPAAVKQVSDDKLLELALIENIQRQELNPIEEAGAYRKLIDNMGFTQEALATSVGKDRTLIATSLRLLKLPADIQTLIEDGKLSAGHGRALLLTDDIILQRRVARSVIEKSLSVRETERAVKNSGSHRIKSIIGKSDASSVKDPNLTAAETKLRRRLGTNVSILPNSKRAGGRLEIEYYNQDDLDRIYQTIIE
ncbi:MAG: ParB/RepB/Spo0J family partition protein [Pyrinomonadaceae bacterium]